MKIQLTPAMRMRLLYAETLEIKLPEGWVMVPKQATPTMTAAGRYADDDGQTLSRAQAERVWDTMVTMAPTLDQDGWKP